MLISQDMMIVFKKSKKTNLKICIAECDRGFVVFAKHKNKIIKPKRHMIYIEAIKDYNRR